MLRVLNYNKKNLSDIELDEKHLIELLSMVESKEITDNVAKKILEKLIEKPFDVKEYVKKESIQKISGERELKSICEKVVKDNSDAVFDVKSGNPKSIQFLIGQVMRETKGQADPAVVNKIMTDLLK